MSREKYIENIGKGHPMLHELGIPNFHINILCVEDMVLWQLQEDFQEW